MQEELETTAHVTAAHSSAFTPRKRKHYTKFTTQSYRDRSWDVTRSQNLKITPDQTQTGPLCAIFFFSRGKISRKILVKTRHLCVNEIKMD